VVLTLGLVLLLAGLVVGAFYGTLEFVQIKDTSSRFCALLRTARAQAANEGRRFRIRFDPETTQPQVTFEPDPLGEPGEFRNVLTWWARAAELAGGVRVQRCELTGAAAFAGLDPSQLADDEEGSERAALTFYPDGSSDSACIVLAHDDEEHPWAVEITLNGVDGTISTRQIDAEEYFSEAP